ncbi:NAD(P)/FAD-dependent oxidoreductase [Sphingomonas lacunae]|uniref:NAD(P)/FAD-dependent oxidoreductase n=1 Tax=Sphingomonas lacunae TaxID=2698828 RepID=A0A6M4AU17_9SPHN|nr:NAD(P)/FAD-dependent oxidoreductase [Sphingomonas lacunae]QJQ32618.1 NAD(P)/FAD-dependent oxidoreductase [Sphingomonas lacunae]
MMASDPGIFDVVIIGAGFSGLYAIHKLRKTHSVVCLEAGDGVGGTWYWNRYPGARVDIKSVEYSYGFDEELQQDWKWPEIFSAQPDLERYANHVADRFDLRKDIRLSTAVSSLSFDEARNRWDVRSANGDHIVCKYVVAATGALSAPNTPDWPGREKFRGEIYHTSRWPDEPLDLAGKRVGIIGTGSTAIQAAPILAEQCKHLTVFQRTPAYSMPSGNRPMDVALERDWKDNYPDRRVRMLDTYGVSIIDYPTKSAHDYTPAEQHEILEAGWASKSAFQLMVAFTDVMTDRAANEVVCEFVRGKIREIVEDPDTAEKLCPKDYPIGAKRLCIDNGYYAMFNRANVSLVDVKIAPIEAFTLNGLKTSEADHDLDVIITATGFDALTGALTRIDVTGLNGLTLADKWRNGPTANLGFMIAGFPNLFMVHGPLTPAALAQMITAGEWQVNYIAGMITDLERDGFSRIDTSIEAEQLWAAEVDATASHTLYGQARSWYNGRNIDGKEGGFMVYVGGFPRYRELCQAAVQNGFQGFLRS